MNLKDEAALHTIRVISSSDKKHIENIGGGCLLFFRNLLFVLSVKHIKKSKKSLLFVIFHNSPSLGIFPNWAGLNPTYLRGARTRFNIKIAKIIAKIANKLKIKNYMDLLIKNTGDLDFFTCIYPLIYLPIFHLPINSIYYNKKYKTFNQNQIVIPTKNNNYCFYGLTNFRYENKLPLCDEIFINNVKYLKTKGYYHIFKVNVDNRNLKGCSGSPILDENGNLVSLVVKRTRFKRNKIYGINLERVKIAFHMEANSILGEEIYE